VDKIGDCINSKFLAKMRFFTTWNDIKWLVLVEKCEIYEKENESQFCGFRASNKNIGEMAFFLKLPLES